MSHSRPFQAVEVPVAVAVAFKLEVCVGEGGREGVGEEVWHSVAERVLVGTR